MDDEFGSDSSDEDYVPDGKAEEAVSEIESDGDPEEPVSGSEELNYKCRKRTKTVSKPDKKAKVERDKSKTDEEKSHKLEITEEQKKKNADDLWADFMKDTGFKPKNSKVESSSIQSKVWQTSNKPIPQEENITSTKNQPNKVKITQIFDYAGEEIKVEKEVDANSAEARVLSKVTPETSRLKKTGGFSGISNVLSQIGKKQKISTLEKTKLDWDRFKKDENIEEELQIHNKGKDGYLEKQDFLQRADLRRFEIEKNVRNVERAKRYNSTL